MESIAQTRSDTKATVELLRLDRTELEQLAREFGEPAYRGRQLFKWIYGKGVSSFDEMTDLPKPFRQRLSEEAVIRRLLPARTARSSDGTVKALFSLPSGRQFETVLIPDLNPDGTANRLTVCVSSQVGCAMGCSFCATGTMGFKENLSAGEIFDQVRYMNDLANETFGRGITNVVFMGMGEPLLNYDQVLRSLELLTDADGLEVSPRRITVSTVGLARRIRRLADDDPGVNLAVSLHAPSDEKRSAIMPVNRAAATDLTALQDAIRYYHQHTGRRITYEYCMFDRLNDTVEDANQLVEITRWAPSKVNLLMYNPVEGLEFRRSSDTRLDAFIQVLVAAGVTVTVRRSRGQDIDAACGQLAVKST